MTFYIGQKIVCIANEYQGFKAHSNNPLTYRFNHILIVGKVYTVRGITYPNNPNNPPAICLEELVHPRRTTRGFPAPCFRPIKEVKTDISIFTEMLNTNHKELVS